MITSRVWVFLGTLVLAGFTSPVFSSGRAGDKELLPAEQAFVIDGRRIAAGKVEITVTAADGYAVYKERMSVTTEGMDGGVPNVKFPEPQAVMPMPGGTVLHKYKGTNTFTVRTPKQGGELVLVVEVQGCADVGVCYQPIQKRLVFQ